MHNPLWGRRRSPRPVILLRVDTDRRPKPVYVGRLRIGRLGGLLAVLVLVLAIVVSGCGTPVPNADTTRPTWVPPDVIDWPGGLTIRSIPPGSPTSRPTALRTSAEANCFTPLLH